MNVYVATIIMLLFNAVAANAADYSVPDTQSDRGNSSLAEPSLPLEEDEFREALAKWQKDVLAKSANSYPALSLAREEQGLTIVKFQLNDTGAANQCTVTRSSGHYMLDAAACRLIISTTPTPVLADKQGKAKPFWAMLPVRWVIGDKLEHVEGAP